MKLPRIKYNYHSYICICVFVFMCFLFIYVFAGILTGSDSPANIPTTFAYLLGGISNGLGSYLDPAQK